MTGSYTMTFADIKEASKPVKTDRFGNVILPRQSRYASLKNWVWVLILLGLFSTLVLWEYPQRPAASTVSSDVLFPQDMIALAVIVLAPLLLVLAMLYFSVLAVAPPNQNNPRTGHFKKMPARTKFLIVVFEILVLTPVFLANAPSLRWDWPMTRGQVLLLGLIPWIGAIFATAPLSRIRQRRWWNANIPFQKPFDIQIDEEGVRFKNEYLDQLLRWSNFTQVYETNNLFFLKGFTAAELYIVPKRAFTQPTDDQELRTLFINHVPQTLLVEQPHGFPVAVAS